MEPFLRLGLCLLSLVTITFSQDVPSSKSSSAAPYPLPSGHSLSSSLFGTGTGTAPLGTGYSSSSSSFASIPSISSDSSVAAPISSSVSVSLSASSFSTSYIPGKSYSGSHVSAGAPSYSGSASVSGFISGSSQAVSGSLSNSGAASSSQYGSISASASGSTYLSSSAAASSGQVSSQPASSQAAPSSHPASSQPSSSQPPASSSLPAGYTVATSETTISGTPTAISATFTPTTYSDYTDISTTTTISTTVTDDDGGPTIIPIVIGPGGIGFKFPPIGPIGPVTIPPPPSVPETPDTDPSEPDAPEDPEDPSEQDGEDYAEQLCPTGGAKVKRSEYNHLTKRVEQILTSTEPLKSALGLFGADKAGNAYASSVLDGANNLILNKFPKGNENAYVTGMTGKWTPPAKVTIGGTQFAANAEVPFTVRWDYDPSKGPHVNIAIGKGGTQTKFAVEQDLQGLAADSPEVKKQMGQIVKEMNNQAGGYDMAKNRGSTNPEFPVSREDSLSKLRDYFKSVSAGPC